MKLLLRLDLRIYRVMRGRCWAGAHEMRVQLPNRTKFRPQDWSDYLGFRLVVRMR